MRILITLLLAILLFPASATASKPLELVFWTSEMDKEKVLTIEYLTNGFHAYHPDIKVTIKSMNENELRKRFLLAVRDGKRPDIVNTGSETVVGLGVDKLLNMKVTTETMRSIGVDRFYTGARNMLRDAATGQFYGLPFHGWVQGIWYRKDWFAKAGLKPPNTPARILAAAKKLHSPAQGRYGILIGTKPDSYAVQVFTQFMLANGDRILDGNGRVVIDSPGTIKTLEYYKQLASYSPPGPQTWRGRDFYLQGKLAMFFYSTFIMDDLALPSVASGSLTGKNFKELDGTKFDPTLLANTGMVSTIKGQHSASYGMINALGISAEDSVRAKAAATFVKFLYRPDVYLTWLHMAPGGMLPVVKGVADKTAFHQDLQGVFLHYGTRKLGSIISGMDNIMSTSFREGVLHKEVARIIGAGILQNMIANTVAGKISPRAAVVKAADDMHKLINE